MFSQLEPYLFAIKTAAVALLLVAVFMYGHHEGARSVQADWDAAKVVALELEKAATLANNKRVENLVTYYADNAQQVEKSHAIAINKLNHDLSVARAHIIASGGLRISNNVCSAPGGPGAPSSGGSDAAGPGTVALPQQITDDLLEQAGSADQVSATLRALQDWVRLNGFYKDQ